SIAVRYIGDIFLDHYDQTLANAYRHPITVDGKTSLGVLDAPDVEQFEDIVEVCIEAGKGFVLVFSLTQEGSLEAVERLRQQIVLMKNDSSSLFTQAPIVVVGTKLDLVNEREVHQNTIQTLSNQWGVPFYETSAKRNWHVSEAIENLVRQLWAQYPEAEKPRTPRKKPCF
ncbi:hypothetical protein GYMLUDRAFT_110909, partial [Collybiopsis luxurians FD-317 M1]